MSTHAILGSLAKAGPALVLALGALAPLGCTSPQAREPYSMVSPDEVERMLPAPDVVVIDANPRETYEKHHLPGARHYRSAPFAEVLPADKGARLVFYCASPT